MDAKISIPDDLKGCHRLNTETRRSLEAIRPDRYGIRKSNQGLDVRVSKEATTRALRFLEAFVRALEERGHSVEPLGPSNKQACALVDGQRIRFYLIERVSRTERLPEPGRTYHFREFDYSPAGKLKFIIDEYWPKDLRKTWADGKNQRIEDKIDSIVEKVVEFAEPLRLHEEEWQRKQQEWEAQRREAELRRQAAEREAAFQSELFEQAAAWQKSQDALRFIDAVEAQMTEDSGGLPEGSAGARWIAWARAVAVGSNPINRGCPQVERFADGGDQPEA